jgi:hypothetical protein
MSDHVPLRNQTREMQQAADHTPQTPSPDQAMDFAQPRSPRAGLRPERSPAAAASGNERGGKKGRQGSSPASAADAAVAPEASDTSFQVPEGVAQRLIEEMGKIDLVLKVVEEIREENRAMAALVQEKDVIIQQLKNDMEMRAERFDRELAALKVSQYAMLEEARAPLIAPIANSVVLSPEVRANLPPPDLKEFGSLTLDNVALKLGVQPSMLQSYTNPRATGNRSTVWRTGEPCSRIEVQFKNQLDKRAAMLAVNRRKVLEVCHIVMRDHLLPAELKEKAGLQATAADTLIANYERVTWRRSRFSWWVKNPTGDGGSWALLSHLDVPAGSTPEQVLQAAKLATERAAAASSSHSRRRGGGSQPSEPTGFPGNGPRA